MSGIVLALAGRTTGAPAPTVIGQAFGGGFYAGAIGVSGVATHYLIIAPRSTWSFTKYALKNANTAIPGADSDTDGAQNTADMVADGNATVYPAAHYCNNLTVGAYTDWYLAAKNEQEICYYNLRPNTVNNVTTAGINPNAIPPRASNYTTTVPGQTTATDFRNPSWAERIETGDYWCSTEISSTNGQRKSFYYGALDSVSKTLTQYVRAIRKEPV